MIKGSAQKFETLSDGSCKLSIYYPRELKKSVLELEGDYCITMTEDEYSRLSEGKATGIPESLRQPLLTLVTMIQDILTEKGEGSGD